MFFLEKYGELFLQTRQQVYEGKKERSGNVLIYSAVHVESSPGYMAS